MDHRSEDPYVIRADCVIRAELRRLEGTEPMREQFPGRHLIRQFTVNGSQ